MSHILQVLNVPGSITGSTFRPPVKVIDISSTAFPTGVSVTIDGVTLINGDRVLFTNIASINDNNKVYKVGGIGSSLTWTMQTDSHDQGLPSDGDMMLVQQGAVYADTIWTFNGSIWKLFTFSVPLQQHLLFNPDCTFDIGSSSSGRPRDIFNCRDVFVGRHIRNEVDGIGDVGASGANRFNKLFLKNQAVLGLASQATGSYAALWAGDHANITAVAGSDASNGFVGFYQSGTKVVWQNDLTDLGLKFVSGANLNISLMASGSIQMERASGANILWMTDGSGNIGSLTQRPDQAFIKTKAVMPLLESFSGSDLTLDSKGSNLLIKIAGVDALRIDSSRNLEFLSTGKLLWSVDGASDIGEAAARRPGSVHVKNELHINGLVSSAALAVTSTTKGFRPPVMTQAQRDAISGAVPGLLIHNSDSGKLNLYTTLWNEIQSTSFSGSIGVWTKYTVSHAALQAAATSNHIELFNAPAKTLITGVLIKHSVAFAGVGITGYTLSVGVSSDLSKFSTPFDVFQAAGESAHQSSVVQKMTAFGSATSVRLSAISVGANLDQSSGGTVEIWVQTVTVP